MTAAIPDDIMQSAHDVWLKSLRDDAPFGLLIARAIIAERNRATEAERERCALIAEECAKTAEAFAAKHFDKPSIDFMRYADGCKNAARAIRQPTGE